MREGGSERGRGVGREGGREGMVTPYRSIEHKHNHSDKV